LLNRGSRYFLKVPTAGIAAIFGPQGPAVVKGEKNGTGIVDRYPVLDHHHGDGCLGVLNKQCVVPHAQAINEIELCSCMVQNLKPSPEMIQ